MNTEWAAIHRSDLIHVAQGYASCIANGQQMRLADGSVMRAIDVYNAIACGHRVDFRTPTIEGWGECANPVTGAVRTYARGVEITFEDGRKVALTTGHVLPLKKEVVYEGHELDLHGELKNTPFTEQWTIRAGQVKPGMKLLDGRVASVTALPKINAVRLWTAHPGWLTTADGLAIGSRWHEILHAWCVIRKVPTFDNEGDRDYDYKYAEYYPTSATGWVWGTGWGGVHTAYDLSPSNPTSVYKGRSTDLPSPIGGIGEAFNVANTIAKRWHTAWYFEGPSRAAKNLKLQAQDLGFDTKLGDIPGVAREINQQRRAAARRSMELVGSSRVNQTLQEDLARGSEVLGNPIFVEGLTASPLSKVA